MSNSLSNVTKLSTKLRTLERDVNLLRSFVISAAGKDREGTYRPEFIRDMRKATQEKPTLRFRGVSSFLQDLRKV